MTSTAIPRLLTLKQAAELLGGNIPASTLRAEVLAGRLRCVRARPGCNAPILVSEAAIADWLRDYAGQRQNALSPVEAKRLNEEAAPMSQEFGATNVNATSSGTVRKRRSPPRALPVRQTSPGS